MSEDIQMKNGLPPSKLRLMLLMAFVYILMLTSAFLGFIGQLFHWLLFDSFGRSDRHIKQKPKWTKDDTEGDYYAIIIGAGFSGLGMAIKLNELGMDNYAVLERRSHVGGTWYDNQYPGCACDVPSNLYSFSFEPNPNWSYYFGRQPEIAQYLEHCTDKYGIRRHIQLETTVIQCKWLEDRQVWQVTTQSNGQEKHLFSRFILSGQGALSNASYPTDIPGVDIFQGQMCHTSQWDKTIDFKNKRVAVIGTGASAVQAVPEVHKMDVSQLLVFQRTPAWIIPRLDRKVSDFEKRLFTQFPIIQKIIRGTVYWMRETVVLSFVYRWPIRFIYDEMVKFHLFQQVKDEQLRKKLTPTWDLGCKRVLLTNDYYPVLQQPNVSVITNRIGELKPNSIVTYDGDEYPVDIIIWSTGFQVQKVSWAQYGLSGRSLNEQWSHTMQAYRGVSVPNFPNFFLLLGPNSGLGHNSAILMLEAQLKYVVEALVYMQKNAARSVSVKQDASDRYNERLQSKLKTTVWQSGGCRSWYQDAKGVNTRVWPDFTWVFDLFMRNFDFKNYHLTMFE